MIPFAKAPGIYIKLDVASGLVSALTPAGRDEQHATFTNQPGQIAYQSVTKFPGLLFLLDLERPSNQRALTIPPDFGASTPFAIWQPCKRWRWTGSTSSSLIGCGNRSQAVRDAQPEPSGTP